MKPLSIHPRWDLIFTPKGFAILNACLIGLAAELAAVALKQGVDWLRFWRVQLALHFSPWLWLPILGLVGAGLAGWLINQFAPEAVGSGVPHFKAVLAGFPIRLDGRVALTKLVSNMVTLGSGITLGRQGPTVHIGAALAAQLSRWAPTTPDYRRQMIAAGAAARLAAGFN